MNFINADLSQRGCSCVEFENGTKLVTVSRAVNAKWSPTNISESPTVHSYLLSCAWRTASSLYARGLAAVPGAATEGFPGMHGARKPKVSVRLSIYFLSSVLFSLVLVLGELCGNPVNGTTDPFSTPTSCGYPPCSGGALRRRALYVVFQTAIRHAGRLECTSLIYLQQVLQQVSIKEWH
ncbi:hypothetical protein EDD15DRAFT_1353821 [Pisolithus albus]|nr:hypothetical protein EDD15DRAFT_1353821 [Pisolithus albus]